jgi:hypothetical protein
MACCGFQEAACDSEKMFRKPEMMVKNSKKIEEGFGITFQNHITDDWLSAFSKAELRFPVLFEVLPEFEILMRLSVFS